MAVVARRAATCNTVAVVAGTRVPPAVGVDGWLKQCRARGAPGVSAALPGVCGEVLFGAGAGAGAGCGVGGRTRTRRAAARRGLCLARTEWRAVPGGSLAGCSPACCCFLVFASLFLLLL